MYGDIDRTRVISQTAAFVALITIGAWISLPFVPVPITLQTLFVLLAGAVMRRRGIYPIIAYLGLGIMNAPVFHNGLGGIGVLLGPTGGYLAGFLPAALIIGLAFESESGYLWILGISAGTGAIYMCGIAWLVHSTGLALPAAITVGLLPFLPGDLLKAAAVYLMARRLRAGT
ncbi:MAG: biotin transporter BioY [Methanomicrobiales archaeon]|nr:biotin transporter BioY [Methanomicrobiales archaeon]